MKYLAIICAFDKNFNDFKKTFNESSHTLVKVDCLEKAYGREYIGYLRLKDSASVTQLDRVIQVINMYTR